MNHALDIQLPETVTCHCGKKYTRAEIPTLVFIGQSQLDEDGPMLAYYNCRCSTPGTFTVEVPEKE